MERSGPQRLHVSEPPGRSEKERSTRAERRLPDAVFGKLAADENGSIASVDFSDFSEPSEGVSTHTDTSSSGELAHALIEGRAPAWGEFEARMDGRTAFLGRSQEQLADLYQQIHSLADTSLLQQYEALVEALVCESKDHFLERQQLKGSLRRMEEMTSGQLPEVEEDLQQQLILAELKVREEQQEWQKPEWTTATLERRKESEAAHLQSAVERLKKLSPRLEKSRRMPIRQSTLKNISFIDEVDLSTIDSRNEKYSHVATWADKYLDSGVSLTMDPATNSDEEYSSDGEDPKETVHCSYSYMPSDVEDLKSEATVSLAPRQDSSIASSIRRRLSAFHSKQVDPGVYDLEGPAPVYRLVLAGDAGSGKSSFLLRLSKNEFRDDIPTTLGVDFQMKKMLVNGEKTNLQIWDTAGQERFRSIARSYFRKAHGVLLLYDVTSEISFLSESTDEPIPMCLVGNKVDLRTEQVEGTCVSAAHGEKLAKTYSALFCETSAKEGTNVVEAVLHLAREVKKNARLTQKSEPWMRVKLSMADGKKAISNCCGV
ncbi:ras and EF-hand domain-containing protein-like [Scleropages formosus]|uniref:Ras and EF-hand domain-containing protein-like n=1 Tax=Scleropages formosus TaxID=113540 RepID=A0A0P7UCC3_SCLFO|nr:ras and EF-hand domain-containing protein-like [Scleropages formosus]